jgi:hypothetical protein
MRRWRARKRAQGLKARVTYVSRAEVPPAQALRRLIEARTLALCLLAVRKINRDRALLDRVRRNFAAWQKRGCAVPGASVRAWRQLLRRPWPDMASRLLEQGPRGLQLRGYAPLFGILTARERRAVCHVLRPARVTPSREPDPGPRAASVRCPA